MKSSNVNIENSNSIYNAQEKHEYERSGLTVSVGGDVIDAANTVIQPLERAHQVQDDRLSILYGVKAGTEANDIINDINNQHKVIDGLESDLDNLNKTVTIGGTETDKAVNAAKDKVQNDLHNAKDSKYGGNNDFNINIGIGSTKSQSHSESTTVVANGSNVKAEGDVTITSTQKDINIKGSNVEGNDVKLNAKENLNITASENTNKTEQNSKSSSASIGATIGVGGLQGINAGYSKSQGNIKENGTTYNESTVTANKDLEFTSGKDTNIKGGKISGDKVTGNVGDDLNIESKQDSNSYEEKNTSAGVNIDYNFGSHKIGVGGSASTSNIDSNYNSVTDQSGIYAGNEGFNINVEKNTDLKGGIIDSKAEADKNKISTGTLTYEDIENKAEYEAGGMGVNANINNGADYNEKGVTPNIGMPAGDEAESTTKATIAEGEIEIRDKENQKQDLAGLNRDTQNSLNKLGEIFDKDSIEERQELANLFGELAYNQVHYMKGTDEQKAMYHAVIGGIMSQLTNGDFLAGASATAVNKLVMDEIKKVAGYDPAAMQWLSAALGAVIGEVVSNNAHAGAGTSSSATKNNEVKDIILNPDEVWEGVKDGLYNRGIEELGSIKDFITNPLETVSEVKDFIAAIYNDPSIAGDIKDQLISSYNEKYDKFMNGTAQETGYELADFSVDVALLLTGSGAGKTVLQKFPALNKIVINAKNMIRYDVPTLNMADKIINVGDGVWNNGPVVRGQIIDKALGNNLGYNFPVVDKLENGVLTSIKSMDLNSTSYQTSNGIYKVLVKNIDVLENFDGTIWNGKRINTDMYNKKELEIAIPKVKISKEQQNGILKAKEYAAKHNINIKITVIE